MSIGIGRIQVLRTGAIRSGDDSVNQFVSLTPCICFWTKIASRQALMSVPLEKTDSHPVIAGFRDRLKNDPHDMVAQTSTIEIS
jgi:hypothetical protein